MPSRGHKTEDYLILKRGLSYIQKRIILYCGEDNPLWRGCFSMNLSAIPYWMPCRRNAAPPRAFSSLKNRVVVRMVILLFLEWSFPSARNGHSNDFRLAILMGIRLVILISTQWPFPEIGNEEFQQRRIWARIIALQSPTSSPSSFPTRSSRLSGKACAHPSGRDGHTGCP